MTISSQILLLPLLFVFSYLLLLSFTILASRVGMLFHILYTRGARRENNVGRCLRVNGSADDNYNNKSDSD